MNNYQAEFTSFIKAVCEAYQCESALKPLQDGFAVLCESLSGNIKRKWLNRIYQVAQPFTSHLYSDNDWSNVMALFKALREQVPEVAFDFSVTDGGYTNHAADGMPRRKTFNVIATTPEDYQLIGTLHCDAAGTMEDPFASYDMTLCLN